LSDVLRQPPIPKSAGHVKRELRSMLGPFSIKRITNWNAQIYIKGKKLFIGRYESEGEAAVDYARAVFKYKGDGGT